MTGCAVPNCRPISARLERKRADLPERVVVRLVPENLDESGSQPSHRGSPQPRVLQADQGVPLKSRFAVVNYAESSRTFVEEVADPPAGRGADSQPGPSRGVTEGRANESPAFGCRHSLDPNHRDAPALGIAKVLHRKRSRSEAAASNRLDPVHDSTEPLLVADHAGRVRRLPFRLAWAGSRRGGGDRAVQRAFRSFPMATGRVLPSKTSDPSSSTSSSSHRA